MFNIFKSFGKVVSPEKDDIQKIQNESANEKKNILSSKIGKISGLFEKVVEHIVTEYTSIKEKTKDLSTTNLNLGIKYLEEGNLDEAIFRFKITKKFWPNNYEAQYQLIICMILKEKFDEAEALMRELSEKSPEYKAKIEEKFGNDYATVNDLPEQHTATN